MCCSNKIVSAEISPMRGCPPQDAQQLKEQGASLLLQVSARFKCPKTESLSSGSSDREATFSQAVLQLIILHHLRCNRSKLEQIQGAPLHLPWEHMQSSAQSRKIAG
mmetsp:Transcript_78133/g.150920  ORF Transcript_78133/g.150920 Transcript_78133/m.150920 type:complete len:107 (+) Transcript_78133:33-353(+)